MKKLLKNIILIGFVIVSILLPDVAIYADTRNDFILHVDSMVESGSQVNVGQKLSFNITVTNNSSNTEDVVLHDAVGSWTQIIRVPSGTSRSTTMEKTITTDIPSGSLVQFDFYGTVGDEDIIFGNGASGYNYTYNVAEKRDLKFDVQMRPATGLKVGSSIQYVVMVTNEGNSEVKDIRIDQSLDADAYERISSLAPGEQKVLNMTYRIASGTRLERDIINTFTLTATGYSAQTRNTSFRLSNPGDDLSITIAADPSSYTAGEPISIVLTVKNETSSYMENIDIRRNYGTSSTSGNRTITYLEAGSQTTVTIPFTVPNTNDRQYFYFYNEDGVYLTEASIEIIPSASSETTTTSTNESTNNSVTNATTGSWGSTENTSEAIASDVVILDENSFDSIEEPSGEWSSTWDESSSWSTWELPDDWAVASVQPTPTPSEEYENNNNNNVIEDPWASTNDPWATDNDPWVTEDDPWATDGDPWETGKNEAIVGQETEPVPATNKQQTGSNAVNLPKTGNRVNIALLLLPLCAILIGGLIVFMVKTHRLNSIQ